MTKAKKEGVILRKTALGFENEGVLNPAVFQEGDSVHVFYRAVRKGNYSTIGYCRLEGPLKVVERHEKPILIPHFDYECKGIEDPRIVKIDGLYYLTYTAYDGVNALGALALSTDLVHFKRHGIIVAEITYEEFKRLAESKKEVLNIKYPRYNRQNPMLTKSDNSPAFLWDKNVVFFPRRINGELYFMHRIKPDAQLSHVKDLKDLTKEYWEEYFLNFHENIILRPVHPHEISYLGGGCPPIETADGWLIIYHGVHDTPEGFRYTACAALFDLDNPYKEIARLPYPLFSPEHDYELTGEVNNVCFPTGTARFGDTLYIYYGAADEQIAVASVNFSELMAALLSNTKTDA